MTALVSSSHAHTRSDCRTIETAVRAVETVGLLADYFSRGRCGAFERHEGKLVTLPPQNRNTGQDDGHRGPRINLEIEELE